MRATTRRKKGEGDFLLVSIKFYVKILRKKKHFVNKVEIEKNIFFHKTLSIFFKMNNVDLTHRSD